MDDLKIGVLGSGGRGVIAAHAHHPGQGSRVVACCDLNPATLQRNREVYGSEIYTTGDFRDLLKQDVDAVFVTSPDFLHEEMAMAALGLGKAVYLEKPMAIDTWKMSLSCKCNSTTGCWRLTSSAISRPIIGALTP